MPPKAAKGGKNEPGKKTVEKKKEKIIEDKTFGLKNKKGAKQQKYIQHVTKQVKVGNQKASKIESEQQLQQKKKEEKKKEKEELNTLFKPVQQTVGKGVDPKSVLCAFFKQGQCGKGAKCKFSHDINITRKGEKRNLYEDVRQDEDTMENWDETMLEDVVNKKHGESEKSKPKTSIICKYFLEAVESNKYGWFWECPNGGDKCMYRHALPPGFVLKKDQKKEDKEEKISIEELVEKERAALGVNTTRVTLETFLKWKERKKKEKADTMKKNQDKKKNDFKQGKMLGISGRELFEFNPDLIEGDDAEADEGVIEREMEEEEDAEGEIRIIDIDLERFATLAEEVDGSGTISTSNERAGDTSSAQPTYGKPVENDVGEAGKLSEAAALDETGKLAEAAALGSPPDGSGDHDTDAAIAAAMSATLNGDIDIDIPIDEALFEGDDLDQVEEDLETLELDD